MAYPECAEEICEKIACAQFVNVINDGFTKRTLLLERVTSLKVAIERAMVIKVINENFQRNKNQNKEGRLKQDNRCFNDKNLKEKKREYKKNK